MGQRMAIPYGFKKTADGNVRKVTAEIEIVKQIYQRYVYGDSLGVIAAELETNQIVAPSGNAKWSRSVIDKILSNGKYVSYAIPMELFIAAQFEKSSRTNIQINNDGTTQRKTTRYSSQNVLSGLLVCAECGSNYRRITKPSGEVVWRCANQVEKGKQSQCRYSPSITDVELKALICEKLGITELDEQVLKQQISKILINSTNQIDIVCKFDTNLHL